jgi:cyclase
MLKKRLIPKLQLKHSKIGISERLVLVTTLQFSKAIEVGDPVSQAKIYQAQAADELIFLDLDSDNQKRQPLANIIGKAAEQIFMPFTVGGGIKSLEDFRLLLSSGADKISINTAAVETPNFIEQAANQFGTQCVVVSIDYKQNIAGNYCVCIQNGQRETSLHPLDWAIECEKRGAGEILLTSIDRDGTGKGLDLALTQQVAEAVKIPVITSGGCGQTRHFIEGFSEGKADAVSAGTYFCFKDENPMQTRSQIKNAGIPIRLHT